MNNQHNERSELVYIRAEVLGQLPSGQKQVHILASNADGIRFYTDEHSIIRTPKPVSNADRIRAMTDEELANYLAHYEHNIDVNIYTSIDQTTWLEWLQQPAVEEPE